MSKIKYIIVLLIIVLCSCTSKKTDFKEIDEKTSTINSALYMNIDEIELDTDLARLDIIEGEELKSYTINGDYDFDCNGKEDLVNFNVKFRGNSLEKSEFKINASSIEYEFFSPFKIYVIDLDTNDKYVEFAIYDDGPSGDPSFTFFRYTGKEILILGTVNGYPSFDGNGHMITSSAGFISPALIFEVGKVVDHSIIYTATDYINDMNKDYKVTDDFMAYFMECDNTPENFTPTYDVEEETSFDQDSTLKIKHIEFQGSIPYWYEVELGNGVNGILYFWLGD